MAKQKPHAPGPRPIRDVQKPTLDYIPDKHRFSWLKKIKLDSRMKVAVVIVLVLLVGLFIRNYTQTRDDLVLNDGAKLAAHIGKFLELPGNETPTLATVKDASKLQSQSFFKHAQDGDRALIYPKAGKALLYRPSTKKVVEYMSIELGTVSP